MLGEFYGTGDAPRRGGRRGCGILRTGSFLGGGCGGRCRCLCADVGLVVTWRGPRIFRRVAVVQFRSFRDNLRDRHRPLFHRDGDDLVGCRRRSRGAATQAVDRCFVNRGCLARALPSVAGALLLAAPATSLIGGAPSGALQAATSSQAAGPMDGYVDTLLRPNNPTAENTANSGDTRRELTRLLTADFRDGAEPSAADRSYIAKVVAARTGLSPADADKRVNDVIVQVKADLDKARKAAMKLAIWLTLSLFIGAFSAALAATEGGGLRDGTWGKRAWRR